MKIFVILSSEPWFVRNSIFLCMMMTGWTDATFQQHINMLIHHCDMPPSLLIICKSKVNVDWYWVTTRPLCSDFQLWQTLSMVILNFHSTFTKLSQNMTAGIWVYYCGSLVETVVDIVVNSDKTLSVFLHVIDVITDHHSWYLVGTFFWCTKQCPTLMCYIGLCGPMPLPNY